MRPVAGGHSEVVCTSISRGGAFLSCKNPLPVGAKLIVELHPQGAGGPAIEASCEVTWTSPRGGLTPPGCGVRWNSLRCSSGDQPLRAFATEYLRWSDLPDLPVDGVGSAWLRLDHRGQLSAGFIAEIAEHAGHGAQKAPSGARAATPAATPTGATPTATPAAATPASTTPLAARSEAVTPAQPWPAPAEEPTSDAAVESPPTAVDVLADLMSAALGAPAAIAARPISGAVPTPARASRPLTQVEAAPSGGAARLAAEDAATDPEHDLARPALGWRRTPSGLPGLRITSEPVERGLGERSARNPTPQAQDTGTQPAIALAGPSVTRGTGPSTARSVPVPALGASFAATRSTPAAGEAAMPMAPTARAKVISGVFGDAPAGEPQAAAAPLRDTGRQGTNPGTGAVLPVLAPLTATTARMPSIGPDDWQHGADPDLLLEELSGGIIALPEPAQPPPVPVPEPAPAASAAPRSPEEKTFAYGGSREAIMEQIARARAARAAESGLVPLVPASVRAGSGGQAPVAARQPSAPPRARDSAAMAAHRPDPSAGARGDAPAIALRHGQVQPVLQQWPAGVPRSLASRYKDLQILGQGGHGVVYRARDSALDRYAVLKLLLQSTLSSDVARRYFQREVRLAASLNHANIVHIYDVGESEGVLWYAMEYVDGVPLAQYLLPGKPLPDMSFLYSVFSQLCEALDHAHSQGILHRDVKPDNVLVAADGTVKLFDFGLARGTEQGFGEQSLLLGTPYYMAPEQLSGGKVTAATDAYALGVLLYRLLAGEVPFAKGNVFAAHVLEPPPDPRTLQPGIAAGAVAVVMRLLAKRPEERYPSCRQAAVDLWQACFG